jgi:hypothetical protein
MGIFDLIKALAEKEIDFVLVKPIVPYADLRRDALMVEMGIARVPVA